MLLLDEDICYLIMFVINNTQAYKATAIIHSCILLAWSLLLQRSSVTINTANQL